MENKKKDIQYSFNLVFTDSPHFSPVRLPGYKFIYRSEKIENPTTAREIWKASQSFLKETIEKYNNHQIEGYKTILTTYSLGISWKEGPTTKPTKEKKLYSSIYKIEGEEKTKIEEKKNFRASETIEPNFYIFLVPTVYIFRERAHNPREDIDEEKKIFFVFLSVAYAKRNLQMFYFVGVSIGWFVAIATNLKNLSIAQYVKTTYKVPEKRHFLKKIFMLLLPRYLNFLNFFLGKKFKIYSSIFSI